MTSFNEKLAIRRSEGKFICIGLDPNKEFFPETYTARHSTLKYNYRGSPVFDLFMQIIEATEDVAAAYKFNPSYYLEWIDGEAVMRRLMSELRARGIPAILDGKYGDVYHTNQRLANYAFDVCGANAVTVNPYTGFNNLAPFLERSGKGVIVFCGSTGKTGDIQDAKIAPISPVDQGIDRMAGGNGEEYVYIEYPQYKSIGPKTVSEYAARRISQMSFHAFAELWLTAPGDKPERIARLREIAPSVPFLIPGVVYEHGRAAKAVQASNGNCLLSYSRNIAFIGSWLSSPTDFPQTSQRRAVALNHEIEQTLKLQSQA